MADRAVEGGARPAGAAVDLAGLRDRALALGGIWAGVAAMAAVLLVYLPVLGQYFFGDDFVPLAETSQHSVPAYIKNLFLLRDLTPNWRFLTGLYYLGAYRAFGLNAFPFLLTSVLVHAATAGLCFWLVRRATGAVWPAFLAAAFFGLSAAHVPTVAYVTAAPHVLAGFLLMLAIVTLYEGLTRPRLGWWPAVSIASFAGAVAANEGVAVLAPVFGLVALWTTSEADGWWRDRRRWTRIALVSVPYAVVGGAALSAFAACQCTEAARQGVFEPGSHLYGNFWIYLGRLLYPIGMEPPGEVGAAHLAAGIAVVAVALAALLRGPAFARFCVAFLLLALVPQLPANWVLAPRYVYIAAIPFAMLAAIVFAEAARYAGRLSSVLPALLAIVAFGAIGLSSWQSWEQNQVLATKSEQWRTLVTGLQERYPDLPEGSKVYVRGGPLTDAIWQFFVLPSVGEVVWGDVAVFAVPEATETFCRNPRGDVYVVDYDGGRFVPVAVTSGEAAPPPRVVACQTPARLP